MTRPASLIAMLAVLVFVPTSAQAQNENVIFTMPNSGTCMPPNDGPGSTPEAAIPVSPEALAEDAEGVADWNETSAYECRWVRTAGQFRVVNYWHYRGRLHPGGLATYADRYGGIWIESFAAPEPERHSLQQRPVEVVGLYYDLCRMADIDSQAAETDGVILLNMGGPCHYGRLNGLMLADVRIVEIQSERPERLRGETNRAAFGDLNDLAEADPDTVEAVRAVAESAVNKLASSEADYLAWMGRNADRIAEAASDPDDWTSAQVGWVRGVQQSGHQIPSGLTSRLFAISEHGEYADPYFSESLPVNDAVACFCQTADCVDEWPLLEFDARELTDAVMCLRLTRRNGDWTIAE
ncbi:hypothetical protein [Maricaulis sp.]|uniref:hypothetical protein n=1 Tax=Maricaulis sp. TaxID=1486257 RepID=UPI003A939FE9